MGMTREQAKEALRVLAIFDGWIEKIRKFAGAERDRVREARSCDEAGGHCVVGAPGTVG